MSKSQKGKYCLRIGIFLLLIFLSFPFSESICYANDSKSWTTDANQEIYSNGKEEAKGESESEDDEKPSKIETWVAGMISGLATGINGEFTKLGMT